MFYGMCLEFFFHWNDLSKTNRQIAHNFEFIIETKPPIDAIALLSFDQTTTSKISKWTLVVFSNRTENERERESEKKKRCRAESFTDQFDLYSFELR